MFTSKQEQKYHNLIFRALIKVVEMDIPAKEKSYFQCLVTLIENKRCDEMSKDPFKTINKMLSKD